MRAFRFSAFCAAAAVLALGAASGHAQSRNTGLALSNDKPIQIESDKGIFKGFRVGAKGGQVFHDFTKEAIAESLASLGFEEMAGEFLPDDTEKGPPPKSVLKQRAKAHAKTVRKARRGERRGRGS